MQSDKIILSNLHLLEYKKNEAIQSSEYAMMLFKLNESSLKIFSYLNKNEKLHSIDSACLEHPFINQYKELLIKYYNDSNSFFYVHNGIQILYSNNPYSKLQILNYKNENCFSSDIMVYSNTIIDGDKYELPKDRINILLNKFIFQILQYYIPDKSCKTPTYFAIPILFYITDKDLNSKVKSECLVAIFKYKNARKFNKGEISDKQLINNSDFFIYSIYTNNFIKIDL
jgi:hypothetical protein